MHTRPSAATRTRVCVFRLRCNVASYPQAVLAKAIFFVVDLKIVIKSEPVLVRESPAPISIPIPRHPRGWGRHNLHSHCDAQWAQSGLGLIAVDCCAWVTLQCANIFGTPLSNPSKSAQIDQALARYIAPSIANCDGDCAGRLCVTEQRAEIYSHRWHSG